MASRDRELGVVDKLKILAKDRRYTHGSLAIMLGVTRGTVGSYFSRSNAEPNPAKVRNLAAVVGIPFEWFYDGKPGPPPTEGTMPMMVTAGGPFVDPDDSREFFSARRLYTDFQGEDSNVSDVGAAAVPAEFLNSNMLDPSMIRAEAMDNISMMPFLFPTDNLIFLKSTQPAVGKIVYARDVVVNVSKACQARDWESIYKAFFVRLLLFEKGKLVLRALNTDFEDREVGERFQVLGYLVGIRRRLISGRVTFFLPYGVSATSNSELVDLMNA